MLKVGLEPTRLIQTRDFLATLCYHSHILCCSLDYVFSISYDLGGWCIVSTHLYIKLLIRMELSHSSQFHSVYSLLTLIEVII